ncbi:DUF2845 domain-containing protein [Endozoicomonas sp. SM1973]|uniref:DUF2845 domain-containing protein n=1 Tax=Spartinivicinus marinus TaxID=2994442 RepID=A0A853I4G9_9GAMM|nr:DUF2845 domain-containing protein [Spartinivicinus marinus]MCX4027382.1 DUF2845 domain-containing protein [Spartinivicinus marinus]NYZ66442.1 DUF2845 domain-containing protein [Spartinivicinus marinus]
MSAAGSKIIFIVMILFSIESYAMRCGSKLVLEGYSKSKVLKLCGKPQSKHTYSEKIIEKQENGTRKVFHTEKEVWLYKGVGGRKPREVIFDGDKVNAIKVAN